MAKLSNFPTAYGAHTEERSETARVGCAGACAALGPSVGVRGRDPVHWSPVFTSEVIELIGEIAVYVPAIRRRGMPLNVLRRVSEVYALSLSSVVRISGNSFANL